jgi:hypothetical protein
MKIYGEVDLQAGILVDAAFRLDEAFPASPRVGQVVFKDKVLYICTQISADGLPYWVPLTRQISAYTHVQSSASATWTVNHNLNTSTVNIMVYDTSNRVVIPNNVEIVNDNTVAVYLASAAQGRVVVLTGSLEGSAVPTYAYEFTQTTPSTTWTINHDLGRYPIVRIFVGNQEVQPNTITFTTANTVTVTFATAQVGQAKLI